MKTPERGRFSGLWIALPGLYLAAWAAAGIFFCGSSHTGNVREKERPSRFIDSPVELFPDTLMEHKTDSMIHLITYKTDDGHIRKG